MPNNCTPPAGAADGSLWQIGRGLDLLVREWDAASKCWKDGPPGIGGLIFYSTKIAGFYGWTVIGPAIPPGEGK